MKPLESRTKRASVEWVPAHWQALLQSAEEAVLLLDQFGDVLEANPVAHSLFNLSNGAGGSLASWPDGCSCYSSDGTALSHDGWPVQRALRGESVRRCHVRLRRPDHTHLHDLQFTATRIDGEHGTCLLVLCQDLTALRSVEDALARCESRSRSLFANNLSGIFFMNRDGQFTDANPAALEIAGYTRDELLRLSIADLCAPEWLQTTLEAFRRAVEGDAAPLETVLIRKDGQRRELHINSTPEIENGMVVGLLGVVADITAQKKVEAELRHAVALLDGIANGAGDLIAAVDTSHRYMLVNAAYSREFERILGRRILVGDKLHEVFSARPRERTRALGFWGRALAGESFTATETFDNQRSGPVVYELRFSPVRDARGTLIGASQIVRDVTERAAYTGELERRVSERTAHLQEAIHELERFSYSMVHDMRAPLRAMQSFARILADEYGDTLDGTGKQYLQRIIKAAVRQDQFIMDVLSYSRVMSEDIELHPVTLEDVMEGVMEHNPALQHTDVTLVVETPRCSFLAHKALLIQCLSNLLGNAAKFVAPGVKPVISLRTETVAEGVRLWIEDNGIGIAPEHQDKIFQMFTRLHSSQEYEGTGIGLAIVRKSVERMGGVCGVESRPGAGSRFWVQLPAAPGR